ncbi:hypothetical protein [Nocardia sp. NPDC005745]|uniref:hypothetical protein n=1 Tax=Nocardia sp. NPDC005745 TaxID=3157061 RepID=UPI0033E0190A
MTALEAAGIDPAVRAVAVADTDVVTTAIDIGAQIAAGGADGQGRGPRCHDAGLPNRLGERRNFFQLLDTDDLREGVSGFRAKPRPGLLRPLTESVTRELPLAVDDQRPRPVARLHRPLPRERAGT